MNTENPKAQLRKGALELCVLSIIAEKDAYSSDMIAKLKKAELIVVEGTLYPLLTRLKNDGFLTYRWEESTSGPPRKYFQITESGLSYLKTLINDWSGLVSAVDNLIHRK
jgi:PadR family transcriptional regulator PadR